MVPGRLFSQMASTIKPEVTTHPIYVYGLRIVNALYLYPLVVTAAPPGLVDGFHEWPPLVWVPLSSARVLLDTVPGEAAAGIHKTHRHIPCFSNNNNN